MKDKYKTEGQRLEEFAKMCFRTNESEKLGTKRKETEEKLLENEELFRHFFENNPEYCYIISPEGLILNVNNVALDELGYKKEELVGKSLKTIYAPESLPKLKEVFAKWKKASELKNEEMVTIAKDGKRRTVLLSANVLRDKDGKILSSISVHKDITQLKLAEEELREKEEFNFALFQHNPIQTIVVDREGRVIKTNMAKRKSGDRVPRIGNVMYKDYAGRHEIDMHSELMKCIRNGRTKMFPELKYDDKFLNISIASFPRGAIITSHDITEQKQAEKEKESLQVQLIQSEKMAGIGTLASGIAHEFNNLIHIMRGHAEFAQSTKRPEDIEEALDVVLKTSDEVAKIVGDLLTFAREEPSKKEKETGDINESIEGVLSLMEEYLRKQNIEIVRKYGKTPRIEMNKGEMQQVFLNLVNNARDSMLPRGGKLEIETKQHNGNIKVSISDTGRGIEKENLGKLFEPFYTTKRTEEDDSEFQGAGLGLSVSFGIVKRHGGTFKVRSNVNKGSTFTINLPLKEERGKDLHNNK